MIRLFKRKPKQTFSPARPARCEVEQLESRQFLSASLQVENLDILPGSERMIFNRIRNTNVTIPNVVKDRGVLKLTNTGNATLRITSSKIDGPFKVLGVMPTSIPVGKSVIITVQFIATKPPPYTYNQTNFFSAASSAGAYVGGLTITTNDPANATYKEELAGWFQTDSEKNQEPGLQTIINLLGNFKTNIAPARTVVLSEGSKPTYYGEEVVSAYWQAANTSKVVSVRQLATFHTQGNPVFTNWYDKTTKSAKNIFVTNGADGQSFLPHKSGSSAPAAGNFAAGTSTFGFKIDTEWSDDKLNTNKAGGGHHVRFYPARDHLGNILANTYFMTMDYSINTGTSVQNYDFQDNVYLISNVKPAGN